MITQWRARNTGLQNTKCKIQTDKLQIRNWHNYHLFHWGFTKGLLHNLQYHNSCSVDLRSFNTALKVILTNTQQGCEHDLPPPITLTTTWSFHSLVEVETHIISCTSVSSMKQLVLWTISKLSSHPAKHTQWYHDGPFVQETKAYAKLHCHFPLNTTLPTSEHLNGFQIPSLWKAHSLGYSKQWNVSVSSHSDWSS